MEDSSFLLALILVVIRTVSSIMLSRYKNKIKKDTAHYEAIADEHLAKIYNPVSEQFGVIFWLIVAGLTLNVKEFLILYILWSILEKINVRLKLLQNDIDILTLKNGLITMFGGDYNEYINYNFGSIQVEKVDVDMQNEEKNIIILYKLNNKTVYSTGYIGVNGLTEQEIEKIVHWRKKRFKDYLRYIPPSIMKSENIQEEFENWFTYLDDVRCNY